MFLGENKFSELYGSAMLIHRKSPVRLIGVIAGGTPASAPGVVRLVVSNDDPDFTYTYDVDRLTMRIRDDVALDVATLMLHIVAQNRALRKWSVFSDVQEVPSSDFVIDLGRSPRTGESSQQPDRGDRSCIISSQATLGNKYDIVIEVSTNGKYLLAASDEDQIEIKIEEGLAMELAEAIIDMTGRFRAFRSMEKQADIEQPGQTDQDDAPPG